jgi:hypothetical protein
VRDADIARKAAEAEKTLAKATKRAGTLAGPGEMTAGAEALKRADRKAIPREAREEAAGREALGAQALAVSLKTPQNKEKATLREDTAAEKADAAAAKKADSRSEKPRIDVYDYRSKTQEAAKATAKPGAEGPEAAKEGPESKTPSRDERVLIDLAKGPDAKEAAPAKEAAADPGSFSARLAERLRETANADIVQRGSMILRDGDSGTIRLALKPESLGEVKVRLEVADNNITGTIVVESEAARDAFQSNIEDLVKGFIDSGFKQATLQVSVDAGSGSGARSRGEGLADGSAGRPRGIAAGQAARAFEAHSAPGALNILI